MDHKSCIAKRTRAQRDLYLVLLCNKLKMERGDDSKSISPDYPLKNPSSPCKIDCRNRGMEFPVVPKSGLRGHCNHFEDEGGEFDGDANKESGYDSDKEFESKRGHYEADDIIDVDNFLFDGDYEVEESHEGFVGNYYSYEKEVETDGNEDKMSGYDSKKNYESKQVGHECTEVIDVGKFEVETNDKSQSCNAFTEGDEVINVDKFPFDEFEVEISDESQSCDAFDEVCHESDEVVNVDNFPFDNFVVEISDQRDGAAKRRSKSEERSREGDCAANFEVVDCDFSSRVSEVDSDESQPTSDTSIDDSDDMDYEMEHSDIYAHEESCSSEEGINDVAAKAKKKSKSKVDVASKAKKAVCKVRKCVSFDCDEDDRPEETEGEESDGIDSGNKQLVCDAKTNTKSKVESGDSSVASMGKRLSCKVKKHLSFGGSDEAMCLSDRRTKDSDGFDFEVCSNFLINASKSNPCGREGADKYDHHEETEVEKNYKSGTKVNSHFVESKTCGSIRQSKTNLDNKGNGVTLGGDQIESVGYKKVGNGMEVDVVLHRSSDRTQKKVSQENSPKVNEDSETREQPIKSRLGDYDIFRILADSILDEEAVDGEACGREAKQSCSVVNALNYKFRFEDEDPAPVEKSEIEIEVENLFNEMDFALKCQEMGSFKPMVESENTDIPVAKKNQHTLCNEGKHQLIIDDEIGLKCLYCFHVEREIKFVMPEWAKCKGGSERKKFYLDNDIFISDGLQFKASGGDSGNPSYHSKGSIWDIIPGIRESMFPHQREGFEFLWKNLAGTTNLGELNSSCLSGVGGCIISHAPGTGKTRLTAMFIQSYLKIFPNCRPVVIAPASMLLTWEEEFRKWEVDFPFHNINNLDLSGKENIAALNLLQRNKSSGKDLVRMAKLYSWCKGKSILGVSYSLYGMLAGENFIKMKGHKKQKKVVQEKRRERELLLEYPGLVVLDEGHTPRNHKSRIWNTLLKLQTEKRIILSGTPFQNNFGELFNTLHLVRPAVADVLAKEGSFGVQFKRKYSRTISNGEVSNSAIEKLKATIAPFVNAHKGSILLESLPGLRDLVILLKPPPLQKSLIETLGGTQYMFEYEYKVALVSIHPSLILHCTLSDKEKSIVNKKILEKLRLDPEQGVKTRFLMDFICLSIEKKEKVLIFSQYIPPLELIKDQLEAVFGWNENQVLHMQGKLELKQRQNLITRFNNPKDEAKIMLASTKCCAEGINLVGASRVVLLDVVWNPSVERQAISRAFRLGQKKVVFTYHLMTCGTSEGDKYCRQAEKDRLAELVFSSSGKENDKRKNHAAAAAFNDEIVDAMVGHIKLKDMFKKIIYQPNVTKLIENFGLA